MFKSRPTQSWLRTSNSEAAGAFESVLRDWARGPHCFPSFPFLFSSFPLFLFSSFRNADTNIFWAFQQQSIFHGTDAATLCVVFVQVLSQYM